MRFAVVLLLAVVPTSLAQCYKILDEYEPCPSCAFNWCVCLPTNKCPSVDVHCRPRAMVGWGIYKLRHHLEVCEIHRDCRDALNTGECAHLMNPCITVGDARDVGTMFVYEIEDICNFAHAGDRHEPGTPKPTAAAPSESRS